MGSKISKEFLGGEATKIEFGIEWQAVEKSGVYRRTVADMLPTTGALSTGKTGAAYLQHRTCRANSFGPFALGPKQRQFLRQLNSSIGNAS